MNPLSMRQRPDDCIQLALPEAELKISQPQIESSQADAACKTCKTASD